MSSATSIKGVIARTPRQHSRAGTETLALDDRFDLSSAAELIGLIGDSLRLLFYDDDHPQRSDPGLYVQLQRHNGQLIAKGSNHGWSYPWISLTDEQAATWLMLCRSHNRGVGGYESSVLNLSTTTHPVEAVDPATAHAFRNWFTKRLAQET